MIHVPRLKHANAAKLLSAIGLRSNFFWKKLETARTNTNFHSSNGWGTFRLFPGSPKSWSKTEVLRRNIKS